MHWLRARQGQPDRGSVTVWMITTALTLVLLVGLAVDLSGRVYAKQRAQDIAAEAARAGGQQLQGAAAVRGQGAIVDPRPAIAAANTYIASAPGVTGTATVLGGTRIVTDTTTTYTTKFLGVIGITALTVTGHAEVNVNRVVDGVAQ
jgi:Flp pilus assembly protein TadG